ncbi:MAG: hypothetical protein RL095_3728 [Verrucomicrobiota bacterium]|jgi:ketosteroid isomerase-like protein
MKIALAASLLLCSALFSQAEDAAAPADNAAIDLVSDVKMISSRKANPGSGDAAQAAAIAAVRALMPVYEKAIGSGDIAALKPLFTADCEVVTLTGSELKGFDALSAWWGKVRSYMGEGGSMSVKLLPGTPSIFLADGCILARGKSEETMTAQGKTFSYTSYWTVILQQQPDASWKVRRLHASIDAIDNPFVAAKEKTRSLLWALGALLGGLGLGYAFGRRRPA